MDPITTIRSCILLVQLINQIGYDVKNNSSELERLFKRVTALEQPLEVLAKRQNQELSSRETALNNVLETLEDVNTFLERHQKDNTFDKICNAAQFGNSQIANLNLRLDQCLNVLELNVSTGITVQVDDVNRKLDLLLSQMVITKASSTTTFDNTPHLRWTCTDCTVDNVSSTNTCVACGKVNLNIKLTSHNPSHNPTHVTTSPLPPPPSPVVQHAPESHQDRGREFLSSNGFPLGLQNILLGIIMTLFIYSYLLLA